MHKLLLRQLRLYRNSEAVPKDWEDFIKAVDEAYCQADQEHLLMERSLEISSEELLQHNEELSKALEELKQMQMRLIHSEKMAGLGQLIAGINHEINTPASAINSAIKELKQDHTLLLQQQIELTSELPPPLLHQLLLASQHLSQVSKVLRTTEIRQLAKILETILTGNGIKNARTIGRNLATIGFNEEQLKASITLFKTSLADKISQLLFGLGMTQLHVNDIKIAIDRITALTKALKLYTHSDQAGIAYTDLKEDLNSTLIILHNKLKRAISVKREFAADIPKVKCYANQLNQVWTNLINNAIEALHGAGEITIRLTKQDAKHIAVEIQDNGPGIPLNILPRIFDPYFTTKPKGEGTGLGLSISKEIIDRHKGEISVVTNPGKTVFRVTLLITPEDTQVQL